MTYHVSVHYTWYMTVSNKAQKQATAKMYHKVYIVLSALLLATIFAGLHLFAAEPESFLSLAIYRVANIL